MIVPSNSEIPSHQLIPLQQPKPNTISQTTDQVFQREKAYAHSLALQIQEAHLFRPADILVLCGSSTAGKSSIISALRRSDPNLLESGGDLVSLQLFFNFLEKQNIVPRNDYLFLKSVLTPRKNNLQILDAIASNHYTFKEGISIADKERAMQIAGRLKEALDPYMRDEVGPKHETIMLDQVLTASLNGKASVFDVIRMDALFQHIINKAPLKTAFVYCPVHTLMDRIAERNRQAHERNEVNEIRNEISPLEQYAKLVRKKENDDDIVIDTVTRQQLVQYQEVSFNKWVQEQQQLDPEALRKLDLGKMCTEERDALLAAFGFTDPSIEKVELTPRFKGYNYLIDTSQVSSEQAAQMLKNAHE